MAVASAITLRRARICATSALLVIGTGCGNSNDASTSGPLDASVEAAGDERTAASDAGSDRTGTSPDGSTRVDGADGAIGSNPESGAADTSDTLESGTGVSPGHPALFYTDLVSAPASAYVTLFGHGFGSSRGTSSVTLTGTDVDGYVSWADDRIEVQLGANPVSGSLLVHTTAGDSNALPMAIHQGRLLFVSPMGSDDAAGTEAAPWASLGKGRDGMKPGDVLYVRAGIYAGVDNYSAVLSMHDVPTGTESAPIAIVGYPGETATIGDNTAPRGISLYRGDNNPPLDYLTVAKLHFLPSCEAMSVGSQSGQHDHGRFVANEVSGAHDPCEDGVFTGSASTDWKVLGNWLHDNGNTKLKHGIYLGGYGTMTNWELAWNRIENQHGGRGIQVYGHMPGDRIENLRIHDNTIEEIDRDGIILGNTDADVLTLQDIALWNDVIHRAGRCAGRGIRVDNPTADDIRIFHETLVDNGAGDTACDQSTGEAGAEVAVEAATGVRLANTILTGAAPYIELSANASTFTADHNLYQGGGAAPTSDTAAVTGDPAFVAPNDYHLGPASAAVDKGVDVGIGVDRDGIARPQGAAPDLGAYERAP